MIIQVHKLIAQKAECCEGDRHRVTFLRAEQKPDISWAYRICPSRIPCKMASSSLQSPLVVNIPIGFMKSIHAIVSLLLISSPSCIFLNRNLDCHLCGARIYFLPLSVLVGLLDSLPPAPMKMCQKVSLHPGGGGGGRQLDSLQQLNFF